VIKAITFDLWNTLLGTISYSDLRLCILELFLEDKKVNISKSNLNALYNNYFNFLHPQFKTVKQHHIYTSERIQHLFNKLDLTFSSMELNKIVNEIEAVILKRTPDLKKGVKETIKILSEDYKLGIISDTGVTPGKIIRIVLKRYDLLHHFHTTIFSDEVGYYKPHPKTFKAALKNLNCLPENTIHIGDNLETDIKGAKNCNIYTIWIRDPFQEESNEVQPDYKVDSISEVIEIVKSII
jgi:putative hydrolase of the HAD superfamily